MSCNYCFKKHSGLRCSQCKITYYCDANCQKADWLSHKINCTKTKINSLKSIVLVSGTTTNLIKISEDDFKQFNDCQVPKMLGFHVMYKRWARNNVKPLREIALFLMIDPKTGLADPEWNMECGVVAFALKHSDITEQLFWDIYSYIFHLMDFYSNPKYCYADIHLLKLNNKAFSLYQTQEHNIQKKYENDKLIQMDFLILNEI